MSLMPTIVCKVLFEGEEVYSFFPGTLENGKRLSLYEVTMVLTKHTKMFGMYPPVVVVPESYGYSEGLARSIKSGKYNDAIGLTTCPGNIGNAGFLEFLMEAES